MRRYHLAQINIAQARASMDSVTMKGFVDRLDEINALADASPGFVWRLQTEEGNATEIQAFDDPFMLVNMSAHHALWWVPEGHVPSVDEGKGKLGYLRQHGPSRSAFTFANPFEGDE